MAGAAEYVWGMVIIGTHRLQSHLQLSEGVMTCTIPDKDFQHVPPRQVERLEAHEDIFILGNGYPALRYLLVCRSDDGQSVLFRGPAAMADCIYCKKMPLKTVVIKLTGHLENRPDWDQPLIRFKAWMAASGECLKADGWLLPSSDRIYPRQIQDLARHHIEDSHGPNVEWRFIGRAMNLLPPMTPLWEPRCTEVTPKMRLWSKMVPPCVRMYNSIDMDMWWLRAACQRWIGSSILSNQIVGFPCIKTGIWPPSQKEPWFRIIWAELLFQRILGCPSIDQFLRHRRAWREKKTPANKLHLQLTANKCSNNIFLDNHPKIIQKMLDVKAARILAVI